MKLARAYLLAVLLLFGGSAWAQMISPVEVGYHYIPFTGLSHPDIEGNGNMEVAVSRYDAAVAFPLMLSREKGILAARVAYERLELDYRNWADNSDFPRNLDRFHSIEATLFYNRGINDRWSLFSFLTPGIESDFRGSIGWDDFSIQAAIVFVRSYGEALKLGYGLFYSRSFGEPYPLPAFTFEWYPEGIWSARAILPVIMDLSLELSSIVSTGIKFRMQGNQYHGDPDLFGLENPKLKFRDLTFGPNLEVKIFKWLKADLDAGVAFARRFEFLDGDRQVRDIDLGSTAYFRAALSIPMPQ